MHLMILKLKHIILYYCSCLNFLDYMLKKNVFLRTTKFKAPILQIQAKGNANANTHTKEPVQPHIEESLISNQSSSTRPGSREKIISKNVNTTFTLSESQGSSTNKVETKVKLKKNFEQIEAHPKSGKKIKITPIKDF